VANIGVELYWLRKHMTFAITAVMRRLTMQLKSLSEFTTLTAIITAYGLYISLSFTKLHRRWLFDEEIDIEYYFQPTFKSLSGDISC